MVKVREKSWLQLIKKRQPSSLQPLHKGTLIPALPLKVGIRRKSGSVESSNMDVILRDTWQNICLDLRMRQNCYKYVQRVEKPNQSDDHTACKQAGSFAKNLNWR